MYAIYDNYVEKVLLYFKRRDKFYNFNLLYQTTPPITPINNHTANLIINIF